MVGEAHNFGVIASMAGAMTAVAAAIWAAVRNRKKTGA